MVGMTTTMLITKISSLPLSLIKEVNDFVDFLKTKKKNNINERKFGCAKGLIILHDDFDEPLEDFKEVCSTRDSLKSVFVGFSNCLGAKPRLSLGSEGGFSFSLKAWKGLFSWPRSRLSITFTKNNSSKICC